MPHKLSCHKTVIADYSFIFLKRLKIVVINHDFNYKFKTIIDDYNFELF